MRHSLLVILFVLITTISLTTGSIEKLLKNKKHKNGRHGRYTNKGHGKNDTIPAYEVLFKKSTEKDIFITSVDELMPECFNDPFPPSSSSQGSMPYEWVVMLDELRDFSQECIIIKSIVRVGDFYVYELMAPQMMTITSFVGASENVVIFQNAKIEIGPGKPHFGSPSSSVEPIPHLHNTRNNFGQQRPYLGRLSTQALSCRTELPGPARGFTAGDFSWGLDRIDQKTDNTLDGIFCTDNRGENTHVYIFDTGVAQHTSFASSIHYDFSYYEANPASVPDCNGHGTHVGGLVGSTIYGVAPATTIHSYKILNCDGGGTYGSLLAGLMNFYQNVPSGQISIISMSLGARDSGSAAIRDVMNNIITEKKVPIIVSAGNLAEDACFSFPASIPAVFTVGAIDTANNLAYYSNFGTCVDIFSPGSSIISASGTTNAVLKSGTSMSTPIVAGVVALIASHINNPSTSVAVILNIVKSIATANVIGEMKPTVSTASRLVYAGPGATTTAVPPPPPPVAAPPTPRPTPRPVVPSPPQSLPPPPPPTHPTSGSSNATSFKMTLIGSLLNFAILISIIQSLS